MLAWLSDWLRDIIAVILLAVLVELLLPGKAMLRYARLVIGLFILLTILSPVLSLLKNDMSTHLEAGMKLWDERSAAKEVMMPSLEEIKREAGEMERQREQQSVRLTVVALQEAMRGELEKRTDIPIEHIAVDLVWEKERGGGKTPVIAGVTVTVRSDEDAGGNEANSPGEEVKAVRPVTVDIDMQSAGGDESQAERERDEHPPADPSVSAFIKKALADGWPVRRERIVVVDSASKQTEQGAGEGG
ncbi:stage III sporulation protein AF [Paenibacillus sp. J5C_2022]|uniref:stage III sporulation protein AF n=1 Tax=Paenibacillus sp. J5C2022 TaxID=2977129 RepID=UPI0021CFCD68|nr:stage III sporulation protein AF [Paenibacillus sp. J5C2022]MCU6710146.1 stage III sporulation protein AF [Paenibacillus sp. J5C2022]